MLAPFMKYVFEGRVVRRGADLRRYTFQEIQEKIFLTFLALSLLKNFKETRNWVKQYTSSTLTYGDFNLIRSSANDLHNMLAVVDGVKDITQKLANPKQAAVLRQRNIIPTLAVKRYLRTLDDDYQFLNKLEKSLNVSNNDYRNLRIAISDYLNLNSSRRKIVVTRLLQAVRNKLSGTDVSRKVEEFSQKQKLELSNVVDAEVNVDRVSMTPEELNAYRILAGASNVRRAKMAYDLARTGKGIPGPVASAYFPIMKSVNDLAEGGYTFIKLFQSIVDRAKKSKK
jgi:hypothetical protein